MCSRDSIRSVSQGGEVAPDETTDLPVQPSLRAAKEWAGDDDTVISGAPASCRAYFACDGPLGDAHMPRAGRDGGLNPGCDHSNDRNPSARTFANQAFECVGRGGVACDDQGLDPSTRKVSSDLLGVPLYGLRRARAVGDTRGVAQ